MRILITGINGFIGAWLGKRFSERGDEVFGIFRDGPGQRLAHCPNVRSLRCDVTDRGAVEGVFREVRPARIFHLAAYGTYPRSQRDARRMIETNLTGTLNMLEAAAALGDPKLRILHAGSSSEYGLKGGAMSEDDALAPHDAYGATKAGSTLLVTALAESLGLSAAVLRLFSVYGPLEEEGRLIASLLRAAARGEELRLTSGEQMRDFIHADDVFRAFELACDAPVVQGIYNVGTGVQTSVREAAELVRELVPGWQGARLGLKSLGEERPARCWRADTQRAERELGFKARFDLRAGLRESLDWFR